MSDKEILVAGGIWGYVIGSKIARNGHQVIFYNHHPELIKYMRDHQEYPDKKLNLHPNILPVSDINTVQNIETVVAAVPAQKMRQFMNELKDVQNIKNIIIAAKGIEIKTGKFMTEVIEEIIPEANLMALSGPNFAEQVFYNQPSISLIASKDNRSCYEFIRILNSESFKIEYSDDIIGTQICGALKNIYAIGAGIIKGFQYKDNTDALYITKVLNEIAVILITFGGKIETLVSCAGVGDLTLTCNSSISRNTKLGMYIATSTVKEALNTQQLNEGYSNLQSFYSVLKKYDIHMPIISSLYNILYLEHHPSELLSSLM